MVKKLLVFVSFALLRPQLLRDQHANRDDFGRIDPAELKLDVRDRMYCSETVLEPGATGGGRLRVNDFTIEVKPVPDPDSPGGMICQATVVSPHGETVFQDGALGMEIDPITGKDVNGDGFPDAVFVGFSGGAHCCWTFHIVSLGKKPGRIAQFENRSTASFEDLNHDGKIEILIHDGSFDEGFRMMHPFSPFPLLIVRLVGTRFEDVGDQFWPVYEKEIQNQRSKLKEKDLREFLQSNPTEIHDSLEYLDTKFRILAIALDYLYAGRTTEARGTLGKLWPSDYQEQTWEEMVSGYCSGLRSQLKIPMTSPCARN